MSSNSSKEEESPLKPIPLDELFRMLNFGNINNKAEEPNNSAEVSLSIEEKHHETDNYTEINDEYLDTSINAYKHHDLSPIKENISSFVNDSGYSSSRTNYTTSTCSGLSMANTSEVSIGKSAFLTPANKPHPSTMYSAFKPTNSSKFDSFIVPNKTTASNNKKREKEEKVLFQYTPSSKLHNSNSEMIRKPLFISPIHSVLNNTTNLSQNKQFNDDIPLKQDDCNVFKSAPEIIKVKQCKYIKGNLIGRGGSSEVYHCFDPVQKASRAIKIVNLKQNDDTAVFYLNEVKLLQSLQHSGRVVKLYEYEIVESAGFMVLEMGGKDIDKILKQLSSNLPFYKLLYYWMEMLYCVRDVHKIGIVHSDLKPANFLMAESGIKLIDFGIASHLQTDMTSVIRNSAVGSLNYISPEALKCDASSKYKIKFKSDIWSLGCILYQLVYKKAPFQHIRSMWKKMEAITNENHQIEYPPANWIPQKILETIQKCLQFNSISRPTIDELIAEYDHCDF